MNNENILAFLTALREHNELSWMAEHKKWYQEAAADFDALVQELIERLLPTEPGLAHLEAKNLRFRLNRDTRFGKDKSPYRPAFRAHISPGGRSPVPVGYFLHIEPQKSFLGGGLFVPKGMTEMTEKVRGYVLDHGQELDNILRDRDFAQVYQLLGESLKRPPRGYPEDFPFMEYLKYKSWEIQSPIPDQSILDQSTFCDLAAARFALMRPFHDFLNRALEGYVLPQRP